jgi:succinate dehydrogenase/fumarate reductase flavoprotein subunit
MEFTDFYTYASVWPNIGRGDDWPALLAYSLSGVLYNRKGEEYMKRYTGARRVPPRAAALELRAGNGSPHGGVYLSLRHLPRNLINDFVAETGHGKWIDGLKGIGFDLSNDAVEIAPAGITSFGGCKINAKCETSLEGLYAAGEVASGHQGAYVLVGNMVGSSASMGCIAGEQAASRAAAMSLPQPDASMVEWSGSFIKSLLERRKNGLRPFEIRKAVQHILNENAYLVGRTEGGLQKGIEEIAEVRREMIPRLCVTNHDRRFNQEWLQAIEAINEAQIGELILGSALRRKETRGCHYRDDYPVESDEWLKRITVSNKNGLAAFTEEPVVLQHVRPPAKVA